MRRATVQTIRYGAQRVAKGKSQAYATSAYPFRAGYALGSLMTNKVREGMVQEGQIRGGIQKLERLDADLSATKRQIAMRDEQNSVKPALASGDEKNMEQQVADPNKEKLLDSLTKGQEKIADKLQEQYQKLIDFQVGQVDDDDASSFVSSAASPIDLDRSETKFQQRAFDSIEISCDFLTRNSTAADFAAVKSKTTVGASLDMGGVSVKTEAGRETGRNTQDEHSGKVGTLVISCQVTTKNCRVLSPLVYNPYKLLDAWESSGFKREQLSKHEDGNHINVITETVMGGSLVGFVHLTKSATSHVEEESLATVAKAQVKLGGLAALLAGASGNLSVAREFGSKAGKMLEEAGLQTRFEMHCLGALPTIQKDSVKASIDAFGKYDPENMDGKASPSNQQNPEDLKGDGNYAATQLAKQEAIGSNISKSIAALAGADNEANETLSFGTFITAFSKFVDIMTTEESAGVPIGLNFTTLYGDDVARFANAALLEEEAKAAAGGGAGGN